MTKSRSYQLETSGESATLYVFRPLEPGDTASLSALCAQLPQSVRTLRVDMHAVSCLGGDGTDTIRALLRHWRASRRGEFCLSFRSLHLLATYTHGTPPEPAVPSGWTPAPGSYSESMTAAFL